MLSGQIPDDDMSDDEERIRRPPEPSEYKDRRGTARTEWSDGASMYSNGAGLDEYSYPEKDSCPYPDSIIDMPPFPGPQSEFEEDSAAFGGLPSNIWDCLRGKGRRRVGWTKSAVAIAQSSWLNILLVFLPAAWALHYVQSMSHTVQFAFCFVAIIPLCKLLDYGAENIALYCGKDVGDLIIVTLNNAIEAILAICLLARCQLRLLQSTIVGVVLLRLLLVPACSFITGGARVPSQELHPHQSELNQTLLTTGVLAILLPAAFFAALGSFNFPGNNDIALSDDVRGDILKISRGLAVILLGVYVCSRIFLHGSDSGLHEHKDAPEELKEMVVKMAEKEPEVNPWACAIVLVVTVALMSVTAEFMVRSIEPMQESLQIKAEWFGLVLLPFVSAAGECILSLAYYVHFHLKEYLGTPRSAPKTLAEARSIDLSIQFLIFWLPLLVLLAWATDKPLSLLFDLFEVVLLIGATFLVNYVTADAKTNWVEGVMMLALYIMIALTAWFYSGQPAVRTMLACTSVQEALAAQGVPPDSSFTNISFAGFQATLDDSQISNFTDHLRDLKKLYDVLKQMENK